MTVDYAPEDNLNRVATRAAALADRIRDEDPRELFDELVGLCAGHPAKAAQLLMAFAAWFDPEEETGVLVSRARAITNARVEKIMGRSA